MKQTAGRDQFGERGFASNISFTPVQSGIGRASGLDVSKRQPSWLSTIRYALIRKGALSSRRQQLLPVLTA